LAEPFCVGLLPTRGGDVVLEKTSVKKFHDKGFLIKFHTFLRIFIYLFHLFSQKKTSKGPELFFLRLAPKFRKKVEGVALRTEG